MNIEDYLSDEDRKACEAILNANTSIFSDLVSIAKLSKELDFVGANLSSVDFRRSDLRGFNFKDAILEDCIKDQTTRIDETTNFDGAEVSWLEVDDIPIVDAMRAVEAAQTSAGRRKLLSNLFDNYDSPVHLKKFIAMSIENSNNVEAVLDYSSYYDDSDESDRIYLLKQMARVFHRNIVRQRGNYFSKGTDLKVAEIIKKMRSSHKNFFHEIVSEFDTQSGSAVERLKKALEPKQRDLF